jgi:hypothetical protein
MTAYTVSYSKISFHTTTIEADSNEDILSKVAKLISPQEILRTITEKVSLDDQELKVKTEHVEIVDVNIDEYDEE